MVVTLGHRYRLMAGEVVDLLYGDAEVKHSCGEGMAQDRWGRTWPSPARWRKLLEAAYQQTAGAVAGLYEFEPDAEVGCNGEVEAPAENGQPDLELVEA